IFIGGQRAFRFRQTLREHLLARHCVGGFAKRLYDLAVIEGYGLVILTAATAVLALQSAALEQREGNCGAGAGKFGTALEQIAESDGLESDESAKVDVGIESGARLLDPLACGFDPG